MITFVTTIYDLYGAKTVAESYLNSAKLFLSQDISVIVFTDAIYYEHLKDFEKENIKVIILPLSELSIYNMLMNNRYKLNLPGTRSHSKDTHEYLSLMNSKVEFMLRARAYTDSEYLAWLDIGCSKHFKDFTACISRISNYQPSKSLRVIIPGCYLRPCSFTDLCMQIWWLFLGTFFLCHRDTIQDFYNRSLVSLMKFALHNCITWEVNIWIDILQQDANFFQWYQADHNESFSYLPVQH